MEKDAFGQTTWGFLGFVLGSNYSVVIGMNKASKIPTNGRGKLSVSLYFISFHIHFLLVTRGEERGENWGGGEI